MNFKIGDFLTIPGFEDSLQYTVTNTQVIAGSQQVQVHSVGGWHFSSIFKLATPVKIITHHKLGVPKGHLP